MVPVTTYSGGLIMFKMFAVLMRWWAMNFSSRAVDRKNARLKVLLDAALLLANTSSLTGLANRRGLYEAARVELARSFSNERDLAVIFIDIDFFKDINDSFGHSAGDQVLKKFGHFLRGRVRGNDIISRLSGDEFVVLLPGEDLSGAERIAEKIKSSLMEQEFLIIDTRGNKHRLKIDVSIGAASTSEGLLTFQQMKAVADERMLALKQKR